MSRPVSLGYLIPPSDLISTTSWIVTPLPGAPLSDPEALDNWQYATDIDIEKTVRIDLTRAKEAIDLEASDELRAVLVATSSKTGIQRSSTPVTMRDGENILTLRLDGSECGGDVRVRVVVTSGVAVGTSRLAPRRPGSVLWSQEHRFFLEGDQSRFPTEIVSFADHPTAPVGAAWSLDIDTADLAAPALGCIRLMLNSEHPAYERLKNAPESSEAARTREFMRFDVARQLVTAALATEEFGDRDYAEGCLGWVLHARLTNYFGADGDAVDPLRTRWRTAPWEIDAELQASFHL